MLRTLFFIFLGGLAVPSLPKGICVATFIFSGFGIMFDDFLRTMVVRFFNIELRDSFAYYNKQSILQYKGKMKFTLGAASAHDAFGVFLLCGGTFFYLAFLLGLLPILP